MTYVQRTKGGWRVRHREGGRGGKFLPSLTYERKDQAEAAAERLKLQVSARKPVRPGELLELPALIERWRQSVIGEGNDPLWTGKTVVMVRKLVAARSWSTVADITPDQVDQWRKEGGNARAGAYLRAILNWAMETCDQPVDARVLVKLRPPRERRKPAAPLLSKQEEARQKAVAKKQGPQAVALLHCLRTYAWRPISAAQIDVAHVDLKRATIRIKVKGGDHVEHPILPETVSLLRPLIAGRNPDDPLFIHPTTKARFSLHSSGSIPQWFRDWIGGRSYDLKRASISAMLELGIPPQTVQLFTGHRTISQVLRYARTNEEKAREALETMAHGGARQAPQRRKSQRGKAEKAVKTASRTT